MDMSKNLFIWANLMLIFAFVLILVSLVGLCFDSAWTGDSLITGLCLLVASPVYRGLGVLVMNAERQLKDGDGD